MGVGKVTTRWSRRFLVERTGGEGFVHLDLGTLETGVREENKGGVWCKIRRSIHKRGPLSME